MEQTNTTVSARILVVIASIIVSATVGAISSHTINQAFAADDVRQETNAQNNCDGIFTCGNTGSQAVSIAGSTDSVVHQTLNSINDCSDSDCANDGTNAGSIVDSVNSNLEQTIEQSNAGDIFGITDGCETGSSCSNVASDAASISGSQDSAISTDIDPV